MVAMHIVIVGLFAFAGIGPLYAHSGDHYYAVPGNPIIDGDLSEWPAVSWQPLGDYGGMAGIGIKENDFAGKFAVLWDDKYIYLAAEITDDIHSCDFVKANIFKGDGLQWRIDLGHELIDQDSEIEWGLAFSTLDQKVDHYTWTERQVSFVNESVVRDESTKKTCYELQIALPIEMSTITEIGFSVLVNENDGKSGTVFGVGGEGREGFLQWSSGIAKLPKNSMFFGDLVLVENHQNLGIIKGTVVLEETGEPYQGLGIKVLAGDQLMGKGWTDEGGRFQIVVEPGIYALEFAPGGGIKPIKAKDVKVRSDREVDADIVVEDWGSYFYVNDDAQETGNGSVEYPFRSIGEALSVANVGDTVKVGPGIYREMIELVSGVTLLGAGLDSTFLDGENLRNTVRIRRVHHVTMEGFSVIRGRGSDMPGDSRFEEAAGGVYISGAHHISLARNLIAGNISETSGGGVACYSCDSTVAIFHNLIVGNRAIGGLSGGGGIYLSLRMGSGALVSHNTVVYNEAEFAGGGMFFSDSDPSLNGNIIASNINGGLALREGSEIFNAIPNLTYNIVWGNTGGIYLVLAHGVDDFSTNPLFVAPERGDFRRKKIPLARHTSQGKREIGVAEDVLPRSEQGKHAARPDQEILDLLRERSKHAPSGPVGTRALEVPAARKIEMDTISIELEPWNLAWPEYREKVYDKGSGLPSHLITSLTRDSAGRIWMGTDQGAAYFDGLWTYLDTLTGLPGSDVSLILPSIDGGMLIATDKGLVQYDKGQLETLTQTRHITQVVEDPNGGFWLGTSFFAAHLDSLEITYTFADTAGLEAYRGQPFAAGEGAVWWLLHSDLGRFPSTPVLARYGPDDREVYQLPEGITPVSTYPVSIPGGFWMPVNKIREIESNYSTAITTSLAFVDTGAVQVRIYPIPEKWDDYHFNLYLDQDSSLWAFGASVLPTDQATTLQAMNFDGKKWKGVHLEEVSFPMVQDEVGGFWFNHTRGLVHYGQLGLSALRGEERLSEQSVTSIAEDLYGNLWFGSNSGLHRRSAEGTWEQIPNVDKSVTDVLADQQGQIWVATTDGIYSYNGVTWSNNDEADGLPDTTVVVLAEDAEGFIWAGTLRGLFRRDGEVWGKIPLPVIVPQNSAWPSWGNEEVEEGVNDLYIDAEGKLWIATENGLYLYSDRRILDYFEIFYPERGLSLNKLLALEQSDDIHQAIKEMLGSEIEAAWFLTKVHPEMPFRNAPDSWQLLRDAYRELGQTDKEFSFMVRRTLALLSSAANLGPKDDEPGEGTNLEWKALKDLGSGEVTAILPNQNGGLIFQASQRHVFQQREWTPPSQFSSPHIKTKVKKGLIDQDGNLWMAGENGVSRYDGKEWVVLDMSDGMSHDAIQDVLQDRNGDIWFATQKGLSRYGPDNRPPQTRILRAPGGNIGYGTEKFSLLYEGGDWEWGESVTFSHALIPSSEEPQEEDWSVWDPGTFVQVPVVGWGNFTLYVRARDRMLNVDPTPATWPVRISPPLWAEAWFQITIGLGLALIAFSSTYAVRKRYQVRQAEQARLEAQRKLMEEMESELQTAHDMQMGLMPTESPRIQGFDISGRCLPATHVGGDFFQYFSISDYRVAISLADVTGHAMEAAVPVMMFSGVLESEIKHGGSLVDLFASLNQTLYKTLNKRTFVCFLMGELDTATKKFRLSNCGCPYPYHFKASSGDISELQVDAYPLGVRPEAAYPVIETQLKPGDRIVFCSDGIIEAENSEEEMFGFERTAGTIKKGCQDDLSAPQLLDYLISAVKSFTGDTPQGDDQTVVVLAVEA
jgi:serine phosphatase RsbU (regulator of sigma subunit)/ligand-binding sensor domain-containing protein